MAPRGRAASHAKNVGAHRNQWEICIDTLASCRVDPERKARNFKNGNRPNKRPIDEPDGEPTDKMPEAIRLIKHFKADDMTFQVLQHEGAVTVLGFAAPPPAEHEI